MLIKIFNLNCWLLPPPFSVNNRLRLQKIIQLIKNVNPDVVTLQEVWLHKYVRHLKKHLAEYFFISANKKLFNQSGLVTLSKIKPYKTTMNFFKRTRQYNLTELIANKGYLRVAFAFANQKFFIINTHLYDPIKPSAKNIPIQQFKALKKTCRHQPNIILAGDLNIKEEILAALNDYLFSYVSGKKLGQAIPNKYQQARFNKYLNYPGPYANGTDYVLIKMSPEKKPVLTTSLIKSPIVSDHYPSITTLNNNDIYLNQAALAKSHE